MDINLFPWEGEDTDGKLEKEITAATKETVEGLVTETERIIKEAGALGMPEAVVLLKVFKDEDDVDGCTLTLKYPWHGRPYT